MRAALEYTDALLRLGGRRYFCFCEASLLSNVLREPGLAKTLGTADTVFPDGIALVTLARLRGAKVQRVPGPSFLLAAAEYGVTRGWRHFLYGGGPGVAERLAKRLERDYPGIRIAGIYSPPFRPLPPPEELETKRVIEESGADLLWVCLGSPKQERWCAEHVGRINIPLMLPVGAAFDFHSGDRPWAPAWIRKIGMEWAFRTLTGGRRTFLRNLRCVSTVGLYMAKVALRRILGES
jgi:N-acetylglucosaminyldiphosphoundecaprenol N-acetyl-beta-D-mannosaminyltransferase